MKNYVLGFLFKQIPQGTQVALIRKNKPDWQKGLLNGVGGKIEPNENAFDAMIREFKEEAGVYVPQNYWERFVTLTNGDWIMRVFRAMFTTNVSSPTDEPVDFFFIHDLENRQDIIPNLRWLIPLALSGDRLIDAIYQPHE